MTKILHTYTDVRPKDQIDTLRELARAAVLFDVVSEKCVEPDDYWSFLLRNWGRGNDLIIVEQDVVATHYFISLLENCDRPVCTYPYRLAAGQLSVFDIEPADLAGSFHEFIPQFYEAHFPEFVDGTSLGFTKIGAGVQKRIPLHTYNVQKYEWWYLDSFISWHLAKLRQRVHVHGPSVRHNRTVDINFGGLQLTGEVSN